MTIISTALSGLIASRTRADIAAENIANSQTTGTSGRNSSPAGPAPFQPKTAVATANPSGGVKVTAQLKSPATTPLFSPDSPLADNDGFVGVPNVSIAEELVNLKQAEITYKANAKVIERAQALDQALLDAVDGGDD